MVNFFELQFSKLLFLSMLAKTDSYSGDPRVELPAPGGPDPGDGGWRNHRDGLLCRAFEQAKRLCQFC